MTLTDLNQATYIALETFKKNGQGVITPVWMTAENGRLYVMTIPDSWKVKRIRRNGNVRIAQCDARGNVHSDWLPAQARILDETAWPAMEKRMKAKYGWQYRLFATFGRLRRQGVPAVIEITA